MGKYTEDAKELLKLVGGKENINAVTHCATRMRFVLNDPSIADIKGIEDIPSVKGSFTQDGQFQTIIGNEVPTFYNDFSKISGLKGGLKTVLKTKANSNMSLIGRLMAKISEIFSH